MATFNTKLTISKKELQGLTNTERQRFMAVAESYLSKCSGLEVSKPTKEHCSQALFLSAKGYTWQQVLCQIGWSEKKFQEFKENFEEIRLLDDACKLLFKAHLDSQLQAATTSPDINLNAIKLQMRHNAPTYFNEDVVDIKLFGQLNTEEKVARIINLMAKGQVSVSQTNKLLESMAKLEELSQLPKMEREMTELKERATLALGVDIPS